MPVVPVRHATGQYDVHVEPGILLSLPELLSASLGRRKLVLVTDDIVGRYYDEWTRGTAEARALGARSSDAGIRLRCEARLSFPAGEESKTRETWIRLSDEMLGQGLDRQTGIVALGGGVVGDLAGFVAATYLRGVPYAQVPTTLLAMLDASVGGKVGVDTSLGKNLIGAFHPPAIVVADPLTLLSLPERVYKAGMAEAVKHGLIADAAYFAWIEANARRLLARDLEALTHLVHRSVELKAAVVSADEREGGQRAILNAGHTIAHGLELAAHYRLPHGEAVALGLVAECRIAERLGLAPTGLAERVLGVLRALGLPTRSGSGVSVPQVLEAMLHDKKNRDGQVRLALPTGLGQMHEGDGQWTVPVTEDHLAAAVAGLA
ncbi:MAG: 3-dehydroquinate synthase [Gemmatimonadales bacterium]|nr:3-dehydroquinate synthase [Gemmatimonadales bacterium]